MINLDEEFQIDLGVLKKQVKDISDSIDISSTVEEKDRFSIIEKVSSFWVFRIIAILLGGVCVYFPINHLIEKGFHFNDDFTIAEFILVFGSGLILIALFFLSFFWIKSTSFMEVDFPKRTIKIIKESKNGRESAIKNYQDVYGLIALTYDIEADDANYFLMALTTMGNWKCIISFSEEKTMREWGKMMAKKWEIPYREGYSNPKQRISFSKKKQ